ncbi:MAG: hypothetical protein ABIN05_02840 [candidate division WOR-3 bacterium]
MKKIKMITLILLLLFSSINFAKEKTTSSASIQIVLKLPKLEKNISTTSNLHLSSIPYTPSIKIPQNFEVVDIKIEKGLNFKIKNKTDSKNRIKVSVNIINRKQGDILTKEYDIVLSEQKIYSIKLKNEIFYNLEGKTIFTVISDENGNTCSYGFIH